MGAQHNRWMKWFPLQVSAVSSLVNASPVQNFLFRNYNIPAGRQSHYAGSFQYKLWEAIRASSAAPGYYEECELGDWIHQVCWINEMMCK